VWVTQVFMVGAGLLDWCLVRRLNLQVGISDKAFVMGDEVRPVAMMKHC
jgi:hypothetical protein